MDKNEENTNKIVSPHIDLDKLDQEDYSGPEQIAQVVHQEKGPDDVVDSDDDDLCISDYISALVPSVFGGVIAAVVGLYVFEHVLAVWFGIKSIYFARIVEMTVASVAGWKAAAYIVEISIGKEDSNKVKPFAIGITVIIVLILYIWMMDKFDIKF